MRYSDKHALLKNCDRMFQQLREELPLQLSHRAISKSTFKQRANALKSLRSQLATIHRYNNDSIYLRRKSADLGLPELTQLSPDELTLMDAMLTERLEHAKTTFRRVKSLAKWVKCAMEGGFQGIWGVFRLAKMKKIFSLYQSEELVIDKKIDDQKVLVERVGQFLKPVLRSDRENNVTSLVKIYEHITLLGKRISRTREAIAKEEHRIKKMEQWLRRRKPSMDFFRVPIPSVDHFDQASRIADPLDPLDYSRKRLTIAQEFAKICIASVQAPTSSSVPMHSGEELHVH